MAAMDTPLTVVERDDSALREIYDAPLTLIRPDQHVAWHGERWPGAGVLASVTGRS